MLTKDLLEVTKRKPNIRPQFRDVDEYRSVAAAVIDIYRKGAERGTTRGEIDEEVATLETHDTFKLVRGLSALLERRSTFDHDEPVPASTLREAAFDRGFVTTADERQVVIEEVANSYDLTVSAVERGLWADREDAAILVSAPSIDPDDLLRQYNLSLLQTLLFDAQELEFTVSGNYQEIFGLVKYLGLMYRVDADLTVSVTGPATLLKRTRKYGTTLAKLVPSIMKADEWSISAQVETDVSGETRIYECSLTAEESHRFPDRTADESFDSAVERDFAARIDALAEGWSVEREPTILRAGSRVMIPDFSFVRMRGDGEPAFYLEVIGFWTPEYLREKIEKVRAVESEHPLILAVDASLQCTEADFEGEHVDQVFFYEDSIPVKPVLDRLQAIDHRHVADDAASLTVSDLALPTDASVSIDTLAARHDVEPDAVRRVLETCDQGTVSNDRYVPPNILERIDDVVGSMTEPTLRDLAPTLDEFEVAPGILEELGYEIEYATLDPDDAVIRAQ